VTPGCDRGVTASSRIGSRRDQREAPGQRRAKISNTRRLFGGVYNDQEPRARCACQEHKLRLLTASDHSAPAAVSPGTGEASRGPQPVLPEAAPALPSATARRCPGTCASERSSPALPGNPLPVSTGRGPTPGAHSPRAGAIVPDAGNPAIPGHPVRPSSPQLAHPVHAAAVPAEPH
jgi:hypothetical protein